MNIMDWFRLDGKTAVVTGGTGLYGRQMVEALASAGAKVYTASRNFESNIEYAKKMQEKGLAVFAGQVDQGDEESIKNFLDKIISDGNKVDILVNNSVVRPTKGFHCDSDLIDESFHINGTGLMMISRVFGDHMAQNGGGSIINIGSYMGILGPDYELYKGTEMTTDICGDYFFHKGGMNNYTKFLASHYGPYNIRCNVLNLGGFFNNQPEKFVER